MPISRPQTDQAFDRWLDASLRDRFAEVVHESLPEAMVRLLSDHRSE